GSPKAKLEEFAVTNELGQESENSLRVVEKAPSGHRLSYSPLPAPPFSSPDPDYGRPPLTIQSLVQNDSVGQALPSNATLGSGTRFARHQSLEQSPRTRPRSYTADPLGRGSEHVSWQPQARGSNLRNVVGFEDLQNFGQNSSFSSTQLGVAPHPLAVNQQYPRGHILGSSHNNSSGLPHSSRRTNFANIGNPQSYNFQPSSHDYGDHWQTQSFSSTVNPTHSLNDLDNPMRSLAVPQGSAQYGGALQGYGNNHLA
ncbi:MAG: hypothetical protein Q9214_008081, partial [Letrouitia sp. 1 TL-2023]